MARLIVQVVPAESAALGGPLVAPSLVRIAVAVSREDGLPVSGLTQDDFRVAFAAGAEDVDVAIAGFFREWKWEPTDVEGAGIYTLTILHQSALIPGMRYLYGLQVQVKGINGLVVDQGQGIVDVIKA